MNNRVHIIGTGSPFGDDRLGLMAAESLRDSPVMSDDLFRWIEISVLDRPGALLPMYWQGADIVILLDAVRSGAAPGTRHCIDAHDLPGTGTLCSSHGFGIASAIRLVQVLGDMPARLLVRGMEVDPAWTGFGLSPVLAEAMPLFVGNIVEEALVLAGFHSPAAANRV